MWSRIEDTVPHHPKIVKAGPVASWLWICSLVYANRLLTDGKIETSSLPILGAISHPERAAKRLVDVGLWDVVPGGWQIHDFHAFNPHAVDVKEKRERDRVRKESARNPDGHREESERTPDGHHDVSARNPDASRARDPIPIPLPTKKKGQASSSVRGTPKEQASHAHQPAPQNGTGLRARFDRFMAVYPKQHAIEAAWGEWKKHHPDEALAEVMRKDVLRKRHSQRWQEEDGRFIPRADKYLRDAQWTDLPIVPPVEKRVPWRCAHTPPCSNRAACEIHADVQKYKTLVHESKVPH